MTPIRPSSFAHGCVGAVLSAITACAAAQVSTTAPAAPIQGTCKGIDFNRASLSSTVKIDLLVQVDNTGSPLSSSPIAEVSNSTVLAAVVTSAMSCKYQPAVKDGEPVSGTARLTYQFNSAPSAAPVGRRATIVDPRSCAPTADDYPIESRRREETGTTGITFTIAPNGRLTAFGVVRSSGFLRLDFTALVKLAGCNFRPGTDADGNPTSGSFDVDYVWKLQ